MPSPRSMFHLSRGALLALGGVLVLGAGGGVLWASLRTRSGPVDHARALTRDAAIQKRAEAVAAISEGDYTRAVEALTAVLASGHGAGDESELLRVAMWLEQENTPPVRAAQQPSERQAPRPQVAKAPPPTQRSPLAGPTPLTRRDEPRRTQRVRRRPQQRSQSAVTAAAPPPVDGAEEEALSNVEAPSEEETEGEELAAGGEEPSPATSDETPEAEAALGGSGPSGLDRGQVNTRSDVEEELLGPPQDAGEGGAAASRAAPRPATPAPPVRPAPVVPGPVPLHGELVVSPVPLVGEVWVNGRSYGRPPVIIPDLAPGEVTVELRTGGVVKRSKTVTVEPSKKSFVRFR